MLNGFTVQLSFEGVGRKQWVMPPRDTAKNSWDAVRKLLWVPTCARAQSVQCCTSGCQRTIGKCPERRCVSGATPLDLGALLQVPSSAERRAGCPGFVRIAGRG
mmetsp:Transcript_89691/g.205037  ORF Transcript_89691/g.205037 Transcript_89691/m.205037 type:complete len:104 (-) Transcript_89691:101-412(-)